MKAPSRSKVPVWLLLVAIVGASAIIWALVPTSSKRQQADSDSETSKRRRHRRGPRPICRGCGGRSRCCRARTPTSADAERRGAMNDLLSQADAPTKLTMLLEAAAADPSAPDKDPLWPELVQGLSTIWQGESITSGMDLMFTESRPRARDAVVSSFAKLALERDRRADAARSSRSCRSTSSIFTTGCPPTSNARWRAAARKIAGNDVADLLQGKSPDEARGSIANTSRRSAGQENRESRRGSIGTRGSRVSFSHRETASPASDGSGRVHAGAAAARAVSTTGRRAAADHVDRGRRRTRRGGAACRATGAGPAPAPAADGATR